MKRFSICCATSKMWWFLIMLITAVGCLGVYEFISSRQSYTATAIIQYTNANAVRARTPTAPG